MKILIFTDAHFGENINYETIGGKDYVNVFGSQFPKLLKKLKPKFKNYDLIVNLGDSIFNKNKNADIKRYKQFLNLFKGVKIPVIHLFGNHDTKFIPQEKLNRFIGERKEYYSKDIRGIHHIILTAESHHMGFNPHISREQIGWLKKDIQKTSLPVIVYTHFLLTEQSSKENYYFSPFKENMILIEERKEIRKILEESKKVLLVLNGHMHFYHKEKINRITYLTLPSICENDKKGKPTEEYLELLIDNKKRVKWKLKKLK
jgi:DNA repair exonuclease SbcCD nuclease subunit